jgi:PAS domain S-box-containing protein
MDASTGKPHGGGERAGGPESAREDGAGNDAERLRELIEWLPAVVYEADFGPGGAWRYVSPQIESILGYSASEWTADPGLWASRLHPDDRDDVIEIERSDSELARGGELTLVSEYRLLHRDGHVVWVRDEARRVDPEDAAPYWSGVLVDITETRVAQRALAAEYERYRALVDSLSACVYQSNGDRPGTRELVSPEGKRLLGYSMEEWAADPGLWRSRLHPEDRSRVLLAEERQLQMEPGTPWVSEYRLLDRDGAVVWVRDRAVVAEGANGRPVIDGILTDVTAERGEATGTGATKDLFRLTCRGCGAVRAAEELSPCSDCGGADLDVVSLNSTLAELTATRAQFERLLDGIHRHLEALGSSPERSGRGQWPARARGRIVSRSTSRPFRPER